MKKKLVVIFLVLAILLIFNGLALSGGGTRYHWNDFGPIVVSPAHPWGESAHNETRIDTPPCYRPGFGGGLQNSIVGTITNFTVEFYLKYVIDQERNRQSSTRYNSKSE